MKTLKKIKWLPFAISFWLLTSCTPKPPDVPACEHFAQRLATDALTGHLVLEPSPTCMKQIAEPECGHCVSIVTGKETFYGEKEAHWLNGKPWSKIRQQSVYLPAAESYAPLSAYIIDSCKKMNCSKDVEGFKVRLGPLEAITQPLTNGE